MRNPITKAIRYFRREYPFTSGFGLLTTGIGAAVTTLATLATGGVPLYVIPLASLGFGVSGVLFNMAGMGEGDRPDTNTLSLNGFKIVGNRRDIASISMTQQFITDITKKQQHLGEISAGQQRRIDNHIMDIGQKLARVRVYDEATGAQVSQFSFTRKLIDANGREATQAVATTPVMKAEAAAPVAPVAEQAAPAAVTQAKPVAPEFGVLAQKVDDVAKRVEQLENPETPALEKPKLSAPTA